MFRTTMLTIFRAAAVAALALFLATCGGSNTKILHEGIIPGASTPEGNALPGATGGILPSVFELDGRIAVNRQVSEEQTVTSPGLDALINGQTGTNGSSGLNIEASGSSALTLRAFSPGEYAYGVYGQEIGLNLKPLQTLIDSEVCKAGGGRDDEIPLSYYVGLADYTVGSWRWFGPFGEADVLIGVNNASLRNRFKSPGGNFYICVLAANGSKAANRLPAQGMVADFPVDLGALRASAADDDPGGLTVDAVATTVATGLSTNPAIVSGLQAVSGIEGITLTWDPSDDPNLYRYQVLRDDPSDADPLVVLGTVNAPEVQYLDTTCLSLVEYVYMVRAENNSGLGGAAIVKAMWTP